MSDRDFAWQEVRELGALYDEGFLNPDRAPDVDTGQAIRDRFFDDLELDSNEDISEAYAIYKS